MREQIIQYLNPEKKILTKKRTRLRLRGTYHSFRVLWEKIDRERKKIPLEENGNTYEKNLQSIPY